MSVGVGCLYFVVLCVDVFVCMPMFVVFVFVCFRVGCFYFVVFFVDIFVCVSMVVLFVCMLCWVLVALFWGFIC